MTHEKEQWEELRGMAARQYEQDAQPKPVGVIDLAKMLLDGITITDQKQFRMIAHALIFMNEALNEANSTISTLRGSYRKERERSRSRYKLAVERKRRIKELEAMGEKYEKLRETIWPMLQWWVNWHDTWHTFCIGGSPIDDEAIVIYDSTGSNLSLRAKHMRAFYEAMQVTPEDVDDGVKDDTPEWVKIRDAAAAQFEADGAMRNPCPVIGDRIIYYAVAHTHKTGVKPSVVYLGKREMQEVETLMEWGMTQCNASDLIRDMICGFEIVAVDEDQCIRFGEKGAADQGV